MHTKASAAAAGVGILAFCLPLSLPLRAQAASAILSGTITGVSGGIVPNADYEVVTNAVAAASMQYALARAVRTSFSPLGSMAGTQAAHWDQAARWDTVAFFADQAQGNQQGQATPPAPNPSAPSLPDLGFPASQTQGNPQEQARLDRRSHMLKIHQRLGLITAVPLIATVLSGGLAGGKETSSTARDLHASLGSLTAGLYFTTAYYSIFAPKVPGTKTRGPIRLHKALAWIHGPGMILTPILGVMAFDQKSRGEKIHGIASAHGAVAVITAAAYGLAILSVSVKF